MPSPEKFRETLDDFHVSKDIIDEMYYGFGELESKTSKKIKSAFFRQALDVMSKKNVIRKSEGDHGSKCLL
jgi:hypothetical protein